MALRLPTRGEALADQAYIALRDAIVTHELPPGTRLSVPEMARQLGISRSPVREAIARITYEGLAHIESNRSAVVSEIRIEDLIEIYSLREVLEGLACRLAAERLQQEDVTQLRTILDEHEQAISAGNLERHYELDQEFHATIRRIAQHHRLIESLDRLQEQIRVAMYTTRRSPGGMPQALAEHHAIVDALVSGDPSQAEQAGRAHVSRLLQDLRRRLDGED
ncbi:GntR family transcriptional regulator [Actinobacteria bacterium YIM 96077]|uniref:GntR family transcriptional regulator n=1 Tax=Phytoactinopolyspora halophila TaxID=1981511 RepID=A0A329QFW8_9ACTN|nr:GntR family transcriptional regulator [Phytoactinopolyspora halophila]AYY14186.1 GntR family transcriptional regulator [Actinobacteria bacterium YIM 96077]RAW10222.1 GntR family transcriptional regulator [Phytoactinopolyspora halophila]